MTTIREVAERAGVSTMTVSRVINKSGYISPTTRARVEAAIASGGYLLPQLLIANYAGGLRRKKRFIQIVSGIAGQMVAALTGVLVGSQALGDLLLGALASHHTIRCLRQST